MSNNLKKINEITSSDYKYGFVTNIKEDRIPNGLNEDVVRMISQIKNKNSNSGYFWCRTFLSIVHINTWFCDVNY